MDFNGSLCVLKSFFAFFWVLMDPNRSVCVLVGLYGSSKIFMCSYGYYGSFHKSFNVLLDFDKSLCVLIDSIWSLWKTIGPYASLRFILGPCGLLWVQCPIIPMDHYEFL